MSLSANGADKSVRNQLGQKKKVIKNRIVGLLPFDEFGGFTQTGELPHTSAVVEQNLTGYANKT